MPVHGFFLLILVANSLALWGSNSGIRDWNSPGRDRAAPDRCTQAGTFCSNCQEAYFCQTATATPLVIPCLSNEVCNQPLAFGACRDFTAEGVNAGACDCDTIGNSGFLADPFDAQRYYLCIPSGQQFLATCEDGFVFSNETNTCVEDPVVSGNGSDVDCNVEGVGFHTNDPTCQTYTVCYSNTLPGIELSCPAGQAYDTSIPGCVSECLLGPTAFACPASGSGAFPDTSDCNFFHVCSNGALVFPDVQCPTGQLFDSTSMACVASSTSVVCPVINDCWAAYCDTCGTCPDPSGTNPTAGPNPGVDPSPTSAPGPIVTTPAGGGTPVTPNCNNSKGYFPYAADCKQFWSCQDDDTGGFEAILYRCPGILYFIPSAGNCNIQSELPTNPGCTIIQ